MRRMTHGAAAGRTCQVDEGRPKSMGEPDAAGPGCCANGRPLGQKRCSTFAKKNWLGELQGNQACEDTKKKVGQGGKETMRNES